ncbi:MAG: hypothetical protein ACRDJE_19360 [Dehalococcoidia bacterium]
MATSTSGTPLLQLFQATIDPAWLHVPNYAQKRDLGYPPQKIVTGY